MKTLPSQTQNLLLKEAALSSMNLGVGLTFMRKYDFVMLGYIYQSFFSLSIGIERLCKIILFYEYLMRNDRIAPANFFKSKGHNITLLFKDVSSLAEIYNCNHYFSKLEEEPVYKSILSNLSDFATSNRYFHLNKLSGSMHSEDPVVRWDTEVNNFIINRHFQHSTYQNIKMREIASKMSDFSIVEHRDEKENEISDFNALMEASLKVEIKQKYGMFYTFRLIKALCHLQYEQFFALRSNAFLYEFFTVFRTDEKRALRIKTWNPHPPYKF